MVNMNNMNNVNGSKKNGLTVALVVCIAIIIVLGGYIIYDKDVFNLSKNDPKESVNKNEDSSNKISEDNPNVNNETQTNEGTENQNTTNTSKNSKIGFDASKCNNCDKNYDYAINARGELAYAELSADGKSVKVNLETDAIKNAGSKTITTKTSEQKITFSKKVVDVIYTGYGLDISYDTLLYLMEDGTVEYTPILYAASKNDVRSYGQAGNLTNIVKFYTNIEASSKSGVGGYLTTFAQSSDGTIYDIMSMLAETSNYPYSG